MEEMFIKPVYGGNSVPIVFSCDARYAIFVGVTVKNIILTASPERNYDIIVLELGLDETIKQEIAGQAAGLPHITVRFFDLTHFIERFNLDAIRIMKRFTKEMFFPIFVPYLCKQYSKVLCIDPDILIQRDLAALYDEDLGVNWIGAVVDFECIHDVLTEDNFRLLQRQYIEEELEIPLQQFCNSGVVAFNVQQIWQENGSEQFFNALHVVHFLPDQEIINYTCRGRIHFLNPRWNVQSFSYARYVFKNLTPQEAAPFTDYMNEAWVIHYTYLAKPWFHAGCRAWWRVAKETVFFERICRDFLFNDTDNGMLKLQQDAASIHLIDHQDLARKREERLRRQGEQ